MIKIKSNDTNSSKGLTSISSHSERKYDTIPFRLDFIRELLYEKEIDPIIDLSNEDTEYFVNPNGYKCDNGSNDSDSDGSTHDIRVILNKKKYNFYKVISDIGGKLTYIKSGTTGHIFKGEIKQDGTLINYGVKVVAYPNGKKGDKYGEMNDIRRPENAEIMIIRLLSYFVVKKQTPHIVLPIGTFYTGIETFAKLIEDDVIDQENKHYQRFIKRYQKGKFHNTVSILITEWANRGDLLDFIRNNYREFTLLTWKVLFFQFLSVLAVIQSKFPAFRHNDLKANNVLIHKVNKRNKIFTYTVCRRNYHVPNIGYQIKLWDFDFACIPGIVDNAKVSARWTNFINVQPVQNRYYDMHYFFNTLVKNFFPEFLVDKSIPQEAKDFVNRIVPKKYRESDLYLTERGRIKINDEYLTPDKVLKEDNFFDQFRKSKSRQSEKIPNIKKYVLSQSK